jgi:DNA polymerase-3 subunit delta
VNYFIELLNSLKRGVIAPVYLFHGEEAYLREQAVLRFKEYLLEGGNSEFNFDLIEGEQATPAEIAAKAEMPPFIAGKRLVVVRNPTLFKAGKGSSGERAGEGGDEPVPKGKEAALLEYLKRPLASTCLIFTTGEPVDKRRRLYQAVKKCGRVVEFTFLNRRELARWLDQRARAAGTKFGAGAKELLLDVAGPSLMHLVAELEKLFCYTAGRELITPEDVRKVCPSRVEENIFAIVDAVGEKNCRKALTGIKDLLAAKEPPLRILAMLSRQFRLLLQVHTLQEQGFPPAEIPARLNIHPYVAQKIGSQCRRFNRPLLISIFESLSELDLAVKTGRQEFYPALEKLLLELCAGA